MSYGREVLFVENECSMLICFIRKQSISVPQEYGLRQHFETKHSVFKKKKKMPEDSENKK